MKKNDEFELYIESLSSEGTGIGRKDGLVVFVKNTVPGDLITVHIIKVKTSYAVGIVKKILKKSKHRIEPQCSSFGKCGGCCYQSMDYAFELETKRKTVTDCMQRLGGIDIEADEIFSIKTPSRYRNKGQYPIGFDNDFNTVIGFYAEKSHRIVDCRDCLNAPEVFEIILNVVSKWSAISGVSYYNEQTQIGLLRHIYLREAHSTGEIMVCLVINGINIPKSDLLIDMLRESNAKIVSVVLNINTKKTNVVLGAECKTIYGKDYIEDVLCGLKFKISPLSFFQVNPEGTQLLYALARDFADLKKNELLLDLYCGAGTIGLSMAKDCKKLIGVEIIPEAIENAKQNARENGIINADFICADAGQCAKMLLERGTKPNCVVLDPPRKGCSADTVDAVCKMAPERIVYVSCNPATLARDCKLFSQNGYTVEKCKAVDMFPRTNHVETVVLLSQRRADEHIDIKLDLTKLDLTSAETKPTYDEIKDYVFKKFGLKVSTLYISQVKRKLGLEVGDSFNKPKSENAKQPHVTPEKEEAIMKSFRHFGVI